MKIKKTHGVITSIKNLSKTAKEIEFTLDEPLDFIPGSFVNIFMDIEGEKVRRAYSISSSDDTQKNITVSIRLTPDGKMTPVFWNRDLLGEKLELMGPLGLNTVDKIEHTKIYLFAFGIGAGVVKSIAEHFSNKESLEKMIIVTGSRSEDEILYKKYFDMLAHTHPKIEVEYVVSRPKEDSAFKKGYVQNHIEGRDFNNCSVYICGQENACTQLVQKIKESNPTDCTFLVEAFH
jgi:ring-1,2-phenylacetyl-CoA epoxidase subunit PaaE